MEKHTGFISTRRVRIFGDGSEINFLIKEGRYVWNRPAFHDYTATEVPLEATSDEEALKEVGRMASDEYMNHMQRDGISTRCGA